MKTTIWKPRGDDRAVLVSGAVLFRYAREKYVLQVPEGFGTVTAYKVWTDARVKILAHGQGLEKLSGPSLSVARLALQQRDESTVKTWPCREGCPCAAH